uniref:F-box domain-containing protein n=1 Tax=Ciona intestinalis TaxID=7719 RepID=F6VUV2_CIOIN
MEREAFSIWKDSFKDRFIKLSLSQRLDVAKLFLKLCEVKELTYLITEMDGLLVRNFTRLLPTEVVNEILSYLDPTSMLNCCQVQRSWNEDITRSCDLWKKSCIDIGCKVLKTDVGVNSGKFWREKFVHGSKCFHKLKSHQFHDTLELCGHKQRVYCLQYDGNDKLYSGSGDGQICIWNINSGSLFKTFTVEPCSDIVLATSLLYVGSFTCIISCWNIENGGHCKSYRGHTGAVFSLALNEAHDLLLSGSTDQTARLWKISTCETLHVFHGHDCWVKKVNSVSSPISILCFKFSTLLCVNANILNNLITGVTFK